MDTSETEAEPFALDLIRTAVQLEDSSLSPREAQSEFTPIGWDAIREKGYAAARMPTGSGKSFVALSLAVAAFTERHERTVISTESLALQDQYLTKDFPVILQGLRSLRPSAALPSVAVLKGYSNYACGLEAWNSAAKMLGGAPKLQDDPEQARLQLASMSQSLARRIMAPRQADAVKDALSACLWTIEEYRRGPRGDAPYAERTSAPKEAAGKAWNRVSISSEDCVGKQCPLISLCGPKNARDKAVRADIVITNHYVMAMDAALRLRRFVPAEVDTEKAAVGVHNFIVDEAHSLPGIVRSWTTKETKSADFRDAVLGMEELKIAEHLGTQETKELRQFVSSGQKLADDFEDILVKVDGSRLQPKRDVPLDASHVATFAEFLSRWEKLATRVPDMLRNYRAIGTSASLQIQAVKLARRFERLTESLERLSAAPDPSLARWVNRKIQSAVVSDDMNSPEAQEPDSTEVPFSYLYAGHANVDVSSLIRQRLWHLLDDFGEPHPVARIAMSGTIDRGSLINLGIPARVLDWYDTPFASAYSASRLLVPHTPKYKFATHSSDVLPSLRALIKASPGGSLVLAATVDNGKKYIDSLRKSLHRLGYVIFSQWEGDKSVAVKEWLAYPDPSKAVLVGTRSYMTGIDARHERCTLVVIDRPPRAFSNAVDDRRAEAFPELMRKAVQGWTLSDHVAKTAEDAVYAGDAAILLAQSAGRLIRTEKDRGLVAVLDSRLSSGSDSPTAAILREALADFGVTATGITAFEKSSELSTLAAATRWLKALQM